MNHSPLLLNRYFFTKVALNAQLNGEITAFNQIKSNIDFRKSEPLLVPGSDPEVRIQNYMLTLTVVLEQLDEKVPYYNGEFVVVGYFGVHPSYPADRSDKLVVVNGATMLFGVVREMVANLTARGPFPMVTLVSLNFSNLLTGQEGPKEEIKNENDSVVKRTTHRRKSQSLADEGVKSAQRASSKTLEKTDVKAKTPKSAR